MFSHVMVASNDIERSKKFYDAMFQAVGGKPGEQDAKGRLRYAHNGGVLMVSKPIDGKPATHSNGGTIGLSMASPNRPMPGTKPVSRMVARRSKIRQDFVVKPIWLTSAIPTATSSARFIGRRLPEQTLRGPPAGRSFCTAGVYKSNGSAGTTGSISSGPSFRTCPTFLSTGQNRSASSGADRINPSHRLPPRRATAANPRAR